MDTVSVFSLLEGVVFCLSVVAGIIWLRQRRMRGLYNACKVAIRSENTFDLKGYNGFYFSKTKEHVPEFLPNLILPRKESWRLWRKSLPRGLETRSWASLSCGRPALGRWKLLLGPLLHNFEFRLKWSDVC